MPRRKKTAATEPATDTAAKVGVTRIHDELIVHNVVAAADQLPLHSPLGASSAERWMNCPGSTALARALGPTDNVDDPEYRRNGVLAHELASACLTGDSDAWELAAGFPLLDADALAAVQVYLNYVRETSIARFNGIEIIDYKHGEGVVVEPEENPQLSYYAFGFLAGTTRPEMGSLYVEKRVHLPEFHPQFFGTVDCAVVNLSMIESTGDYADEEPVRLTIVQPRVAWHPKGVVRSWDTTAGALRKWAYGVLQPAMNIAQVTMEFELGEHCRFCPAKMLCPRMREAVEEAVEAERAADVEADGPLPIGDMTQEQLAYYWGRRSAVNMFYKTLDERVFRLFSDGLAEAELHRVAKLVPKITYRVWKGDAQKAAIAALGDKAFTKPELISPAAAEKLGPAGAELVKEYATTPPANGYTLAPLSDNRQAVVIKKTEEKFSAFLGSQKELDALI